MYMLEADYHSMCGNDYQAQSCIFSGVKLV
jgi:hypothetical protein